VMRFFLVLFTLLVVCDDPISAQSSVSYGPFPTWSHGGALSKRMSYGVYYFTAYHLGGRGGEHISSGFLKYGEHSVTLAVRPSFKITGSYVFERLKLADDRWRKENRFYAQALFSIPAGNTIFSHRLRFDGRYIQTSENGPFTFGHRIRYLTGFQTKFPRHKVIDYAGLYNEFFFNTSQEKTFIYAENWASAYVGFKLSDHVSIEAGPLYIFWVTGNGTGLNNLIYGQLTLATTLDFFRHSDKGTQSGAQ
jgi:hypothetical protein